ncbi:AAA domain-containing protein [Candidatus Woesearchaeota archaeon]|nr:AAA domain-containing protein [Candidatus Woesearchaeota archaeon]
MIHDFSKEFTAGDCFSDILGQEATKEQLKSALLMNRHVIIIGSPGIGKTTIARNIAKLLPSVEANDCEYHCNPSNPLCPACRKGKTKTKKIEGINRFIRIQGSPDLTIEDLIGDIDPAKALTHGAMSIEAFTPGKIFKANNGILFFDEVNRCPEKLQNALLQVLEEGKATIGSYTVDLPASFIFIGTMNPQETAATEKLSDVFLDRFDIIHMTYPEKIAMEKEIVLARGEKCSVTQRVPGTHRATLSGKVEFPSLLLEATIDFVRILREHKDLIRKPSVRASIGLYERAQANAVLAERKKVNSEDIAKSVVSVLSHRIELKPSVKYLQTEEEFLAQEFKKYCAEHQELETSGGCL